MKKLSISLLALSLLALTACQTSSLTETEKLPVEKSAVPFSGTVKEIDRTQSVISFVGKSDIINHEGKFNDYSAVMRLDPSEPANLEKASIEASIQIASVATDATGLDGHLQKDDFFSAEKFPTMTFASKSIVKKGDNQYDVTGDLTIKGVTKSVTITAEITDDYLKAHYDLPRQDFGIGNDAYGKKLLEATVPVDVKLVFKKMHVMNGAMVHDDEMTMDDMTTMLEGKTGDDFDRAFIAGMIPHHQGAVDMAKMALKNAKHDEIKKMAAAIIASQQQEIDAMNQWYKDWGYGN